MSKLPSACPEEQFVAWIFLKFWIVSDFCRNYWHGSQNSIYVSRVKIADKIVCFCFLFRIFSIFERYIFRLLAKTLQKFSKLSSACPEEPFVPLKIFKMFWTVMDFLQKPLAWFSKFYLRVQSKNFGRNSFIIFLFRIFLGFERKYFRLPAKNLQKVVKTTFCVSRGTICGLNFFKVLNRFRFSAETIGMVLKILSSSPD